MYRSRALNSLEDTHHARSNFICPGLRLAHDDAGRRPGQQREKGLCYPDGEPQLESVPRRSKRALTSTTRCCLRRRTRSSTTILRAFIPACQIIFGLKRARISASLMTAIPVSTTRAQPRTSSRNSRTRVSPGKRIKRISAVQTARSHQ